MKRHFILLGLLTAISLATGCTSNMVAKRWSKAHFTAHPRVAVFPFDNLSSQEQVGAKITEYFQAFMVAQTRFELVESGTLYDCLRRHRIRSSSLMTTAQLDTVSAELKIDYYVSGTVLEYREMDNIYLGKLPQVSFNTRLVDCAAKTTVWSGVSNGSGDKGEIVFGLGAIRSSDDLARRMASSAVAKISDLFKE
jgi:TolB-like protein